MRIHPRSAGPAVMAAFVLSLVLSSPAHGARQIQGSVGQVTQADGAALGQVGFRIFSALLGGETNFNDNNSSCRNVRCIRSYVLNANLDPGGYVSNADATQVYNGDVQDQPYYELVDANMNDNAENHIGYYGVAGVTGNGNGVGQFLLPGCPPPTATNCFERLDNRFQAPPLTGTVAAYGGAAHTIRAIGGLNPIPNVRIDSVVQNTSANLSWNDPPTYAGAMRPSDSAPAPPSPVLGVRLWKFEDEVVDCMPPLATDPGWTSIGTFDLGDTSTQVPLTPFTCTWFALTVRFIGPGGLPHEIETFRIGTRSQQVGSVNWICVEPCSDGNACTVNDACSSNGFCVGGPPATCNDGNPCTNDTCIPSTGCAFTNNSAACDDGNGCTVNDVCAGGGCGGTTVPPPTEVAHDRFSSRTTLVWDPTPNPGPGAVYDVTLGRVSELPPGSGQNESCRASGLADPTLEVPESAPAGEALWYLVRARNTCGEGTWGTWSNGVPRVPPACP